MKERYAKYGKDSGVNPGLMWMSGEELKEKIAEEADWSPQLFETVKLMKERKLAEKNLYESKLKKLEANIAKYPKEYEEYRAKLMAEQTKSDDYAVKKKQQIQEIQVYFSRHTKILRCLFSSIDFFLNILGLFWLRY